MDFLSTAHGFAGLKIYRKTPFSVLVVGKFTNAKGFVLGNLISETKTDLKYSSSSLLKPVLS
jgi:hypothetical protein